MPSLQHGSRVPGEAVGTAPHLGRRVCPGYLLPESMQILLLFHSFSTTVDFGCFFLFIPAG